MNLQRETTPELRTVFKTYWRNRHSPMMRMAARRVLCELRHRRDIARADTVRLPAIQS